MNNELLKKYCTDRCTAEELSSVLTWFEESAETLEGKSLLLKIWEELPDEDSENKINFDLLLNRIHHEVNLIQSKKLALKSDEDLIKNRRRANFRKIFMRAAAILLFPILGFGIYITVKYQSLDQTQAIASQTYNKVCSPVYAITRVNLPDGSNVWLNHSSSLRYPAAFSGDKRSVELIGEGYFEIAHNSKVPFIVKSGNIEIKALGTTFNVMAYPDDDNIETSLIDGKVEVHWVESNGKETLLVEMKPTDFASFHKRSREIKIQTIEDSRYYSWKEGKLIFNNEPMDEMVKKLSRWFNVDIQIESVELQELTYTATFVNETLPQVLELISMVSPVTYSISNREKKSDGTFSKSKVIFSYRDD